MSLYSMRPFFYTWKKPGDDHSAAWCVAFMLRLSTSVVSRIRASEAAKIRLRAQVDFINGLYCPESGRVLAIRYLVFPDPRSFSAGRVEVVLIGKVSTASEHEAVDEASKLYRDLVAQIGGAMPDSVWKAIDRKERFLELWEPFPWNAASFAEIRRREDVVSFKSVRPRPSLGKGRSAQMVEWDAEDAIYMVHRFKPRSETLERLLRTLLLAQGPVMWQVAISPQRFEEPEEQGLIDEIGKCERYLSGKVHDEPLSGLTTLHKRRANMIREQLLDQLVKLEDAPFLLNISVAAKGELPRTLVEAIGVEITDPPGGGEQEQIGGGYDVLYPESERERVLAQHNARHMVFDDWSRCCAPDQSKRMRKLVDAREAAGAFRLPYTPPEGLPGIRTQVARMRPLPREAAMLETGEDDHDKICLGENNYLGFQNRVYLHQSDRRQHMYTMGQTGTGKSTLLKTMIAADMEAGKGLAVIDPHGDLFQELLTMIPENRWDDVVVFDPTDEEYPVGLNLLECKSPSQRHFVVREMRAIMERLMEDQYGVKASEWAGPAFYQHMQMNMLLAMSNPDDPGTLLEFYEIFQSKYYWRRWLPLKWDEPQLKRWVKGNLSNMDYTKYGGDGNNSWGGYLSSKFDDFVFDPRLRRIFGQKRSLDIRSIMDEKKILLVNLAKGDLTEANARFLGMVLMAKIQSAALERVHIQESQREMFYLYVDEFQSLATENFSLMLSEARKFGLGLVLANQFLSQIRDPRIIQSIFGNVGTIASFRVGQEDAQLLEQHFLPYFDAFDLCNQPNWTASVKATMKGRIAPPFTLRTVKSKTGNNPEQKGIIVKRSQRKYGRPVDEVDKEIERSLGHSIVNDEKTEENEEMQGISDEVLNKVLNLDGSTSNVDSDDGDSSRHE